MAIIQQCLEQCPKSQDGSLDYEHYSRRSKDIHILHNLLSNALDFRRLETIDWLLDGNFTPEKGIISIKPVFLVGYYFTLISILSKFLYPIPSSLRVVEREFRRIGNGSLFSIYAQVLKYVAENEFPDAKLSKRFRIEEDFKHQHLTTYMLREPKDNISLEGSLFLD